ncbi:hypothetical protein ISN45_Aa06g012870 [Arabidopsis thaliana x Arabidopsis arenosa]|uniref:Uncharacterized protein n=1 Tax=Arabidopsis thaliana x Arabidopsis arenosa TaxID=1240361 RepID=A0A8T1YW35_9BRAS|nr:hypothetical protein ISN45_Aa06g012870 [Arabidopsis thaliana x Arabidopsis arenosa]
MSLVDYDDSSSDDDVLAADEKPLPQPQPQPQQRRVSPAESFPPIRQRCEQEEIVEKLPDALFLLESPTLAQVTGGDHASVVAAAMAQSAVRKRDLNGNASSLPRRPKLPRGNLPHSKNYPETLGNVLVPPQLKGRSNVATEDMSRLFVKKQQDSSKARSPDQE